MNFDPGDARTVRRRAFAVCAALTLAIAGCSPAYLDQRTDEPQSGADAVKGADLTPRFPMSVRQSSGGDSRGGGFLSFGAGATTAGAVPDAEPLGAVEGAQETGEGFAINFEASPIPNVAKVMLGDILGLRYTIDPHVQGQINLSSSQPVPKREILFVFESALHANNLVMVKEAGGYRITTMNDGGAFGRTDTAVTPESVQAGYGLTVIPLRYISAPALVRLMEGFSSRPGTVRADPSGRLMLVVGTGQERRASVETARQFDVDWLRGQSVGLVPVRNSSSTAIASELEKILDSGENGLSHGLVKIQDVTAQNAILVVAAQPNLLRAASTWIERLDSPNLRAAGVHVYKVRYGEAKQLAQLLNAMFGSGGGGEVESGAAPGSGTKHLTATERLTGGGAGGGAGQAGGGLGGGGLGGQNQAGGAAGAAGGGAAGGGAANSPFGGLQTNALNQAFAAAGDQGGGGGQANLRITADVQDNSVLVYSSADTYRLIEKALEQIDRPRAQVAIDVTIAEVDLNDALNYGVQFYLANHINMGSVGFSGSGAATPPILTNNDVTSGFNILIGHSQTPHFILNALHQLTDVRILSNPSLVVVDNEQATLEVGDQVPVSTGSATVLSSNNAVVNTVDYKNTGIILDVLPHVSPDNTVQLEISQEISNVVNSTSSASGSSNASLTPTISERKVKSNISVTNGQTVLLAGLVQDTDSKNRAGVPGFDQLPLVGGAFGSTGKSRQRTELIIFIRPQIIHDSVDMSRVAEQLRAKMRGGRIDATSLPNALQVGAKKF